MRDFEPYRSAARKGITDAGMKALLIEDFPSLNVSARTACLDLVQSSDIYLLIIGDRAGSSPLGKPVVEEEFEEARRRKIPRLIFVQDVERDEETEALLQRLSDYVTGRFRIAFNTTDGLQKAVRTALEGLSAMNIETNQASLVDELTILHNPHDRHNGPVLRIVLVPERKDEVFDSLDFEGRDSQRSLYELAHRESVRLFDFEQGAKGATVEERDLVLTQEARRGHGLEIGARIRLREDGAVVIDQTLKHRSRDRHMAGADIQIGESEVVEAIRSSFAFVDALYNSRDPGHRFATFFFAAAVEGMGVHFVMKEIRELRSWSPRMDDERGWQQLDKTRRVDRTDLSDPRESIERTLAFIVKRYGERK